MNPMIIFVATMAVASALLCAGAAVDDRCSLQSSKPVLDFPEYHASDNYYARMNKMFRGYIEIEESGKTEYLPLNLVRANFNGQGGVIDEHIRGDETLTLDCGTVDMLITKTKTDNDIHYFFDTLTYTVGTSVERCSLATGEKRGNAHVYSCVDQRGVNLVIEPLDADKFLSTVTNPNHHVHWS